MRRLVTLFCVDVLCDYATVDWPSDHRSDHAIALETVWHECPKIRRVVILLFWRVFARIKMACWEWRSNFDSATASCSFFFQTAPRDELPAQTLLNRRLQTRSLSSDGSSQYHLPSSSLFMLVCFRLDSILSMIIFWLWNFLDAAVAAWVFLTIYMY